MIPCQVWQVNEIARALTPARPSGRGILAKPSIGSRRRFRSMGQAGQLTKANFGYSIPVDAPLYEPFPMYYEDVTILIFPYVTQAAAAVKLLPSQLELAPVPGDTSEALAGAAMVFANYGFSTVGSYNEVAQTLACVYNGSDATLKGKPVSYAVRLHVDNDMAMTAGREIGGFPKKLGKISFDPTPIYTSTLESPDGLLICSGELQAFAKVGEQQNFPPAMRTQGTAVCLVARDPRSLVDHAAVHPDLVSTPLH